MTPRRSVADDSQRQLLIVEDLMLLLMDDDGATIRAAGTLHYILGGAVLTELALRGRVQTDESGVLNGPKVTPVGDSPLGDPLLQNAFDAVSKKTQRVQPLLMALGADLWREVIDRLVARGLVRQEKSKFLGLIPRTRYVATDDPHEAVLREQIVAVLEEGQDPSPHTAAVIGLIYASGAMPALEPPLPWTSTSIARATEIQQGEWGPEAVASAVNRTAAAIATSSASIVAVAVK